MKKYQVILQDEYNNLYHIGFYNKLEDSINDINDMLDVYKIKIKDEDLKEYAGVFNSVFDLDLGMLYEGREDLLGIMIRGFIFYNFEEEIK